MTKSNYLAFPHTLTSEEKSAYLQKGESFSESWMVGGLTKREYLAGLMMQSCLKYAPIISPQMRPAEIAKMALKHTDALIAELNKDSK